MLNLKATIIEPLFRYHRDVYRDTGQYVALELTLPANVFDDLAIEMNPRAARALDEDRFLIDNFLTVRRAAKR